MIHPEVPVPRERWIGVVPGSRGVFEDPRLFDYGVAENALNDHCLVMSHEDLIFDPACSVRLPPGMKTMGFHPSQIVYGISFSFNKEE